MTNPNVKRCTLSQKQKFLRNKGLTEKEIEIATIRAGKLYFSCDCMNGNFKSVVLGIFDSHAPDKKFNTHTIINMDSRRRSLIVQPSYIPTFYKLRNMFTSLAFLSSLVYAFHFVYKTIIQPFIFGTKKPKTVEQKLDELTCIIENDIKQLYKEVNEIKLNISKNNQTELVKQEIQGFQQDLDKIRGLLLNK